MINKLKLNNLIFYTICLYAFFSVFSITLGEIFFVLGIFLWIIDIVKNKKSLKIQFGSFLTIPIIFFVLIHFISSLIGIDIKNSIKDFRKVYLILMFFLVGNYLKEKEKMKKVLEIFFLGAFLVGVYATYTGFVHRVIEGDKIFRATSFSGNHMHCGGMLMMALIILIAYILYLFYKKEYKKLVICILEGVFVFTGLLFTFTRSSWLGAFFGIFLILFFIDKRLFLYGVILFIVFLFLIRDTYIFNRAIKTFKLMKGSSEMERIYMWKSGFKIMKNYPMGIGTGNLEKIYPGYREKEAKEKNEGHLHNNIIQIGVIDGFLGIIAFLWIFISFWIEFFKNLGEKDIFYKYIILGLLGVNIGFFINGFFEYNFFSSQVVLIFWFLMGIFNSITKIKQKHEN